MDTVDKSRIPPHIDELRRVFLDVGPAPSPGTIPHVDRICNTYPQPYQREMLKNFGFYILGEPKSTGYIWGVVLSVKPQK